jgi:hypothetical protein
LTPPVALSREQLYTNWLAWVITNLGDHPKYAGVAADAAADMAVKGQGFNAAATAAANAWIEAAQNDEPLWRPRFRSLLLTDPYVWALFLLLVAIPLYLVSPQFSIVAILIPFALIGAGWKVYVYLRLSRRGIVALGSLFNVTVKDSDGEMYRNTYEFNFQGRHFVSLSSREFSREMVLILFDPQHPKFAMVIPELLNPGPGPR